MTDLIPRLEWSVPATPRLQWLGPTGEVYAVGQRAQPVALAVIIGPPGKDGLPGTAGPPGTSGDGATDPGDLTLIFNNKLI